MIDGMTLALFIVAAFAMCFSMLARRPGAKWYAARVAAMGECFEMQPIQTTAKPLVTIDP